jgi:signal transduction histidine kinase
MTDSEKQQQSRDHEPDGRLIRGLSGKLLLLTVLFVMISEVLIYVPSIANFRLNWLREKLAAAQIAALVVEAAPSRAVSPELQRRLLANAGVKALAVRRGNARRLLLKSGDVMTIDRHFDLRQERPTLQSVWDAFEALAAGPGRTIRIQDMPRQGGGDFIEIVLAEQPLRAAMIRFSVNILTLSLIISALTAFLVFLALIWLLVRPMRRLTSSMVSFGDDPENAERIIAPSGRRDEIGTAERELEHMQRDLSQTLQQKNRLAALGLAVSKISHDLRNMLSSAQLLSDRLGTVNDPTVRRLAPKLIASLDRAIDFCADTLKFGRAEEAHPRRDRFVLRGHAQDVIDDLKIQIPGDIKWHNGIAIDLEIDADKDHIFRILDNLLRNAAEAITANPEPRPGAISLDALRDGSVVTITIEDNGPGLPKRARDHLFQAFQGGVKAGGTGLGLAIAAELVRAHGGDIAPVEVETGTKFTLTIPDRVAELAPHRQRA